MADMFPPPIPADAERRPRWRYRAMRALTREWLHHELPLSDVVVHEKISGPCQITATLKPVHQGLLAPTGNQLPILDEWSTLVLAEWDGQIRGGGILVDSTFTGQVWSLDIAGFTAYPEKQPIVSTQTWGGPEDGVTGHGVDPLDVVRQLWSWLQSRPDSDLAVLVDSTTSPYRLGEWKNAKKLKVEGSPAPKATEIEDSIPIDKVWTNSDRKPEAAKGKQVYWRHKIYWYDNQHVGEHITSLAGQTPFDYREEYAWNASRTDVVMRLRLGYPRIGRARPDVHLVQGDTITDVIPVQRSGDEFANEVHVYGSGEGSKQLRATVTRRDGRLLRSVLVDRPALTKEAQAKTYAAEELSRRQPMVDIVGFAVDADHPNAGYGKFAPGDDVLVQTRSGWLPTKLWVRVTSMATDTKTGKITVTCQRRDSFNYSGGAVS